MQSNARTGLVVLFFFVLCALLFGSSVSDGFVVDDYKNLLAAQMIVRSGFLGTHPALSPDSVKALAARSLLTIDDDQRLPGRAIRSVSRLSIRADLAHGQGQTAANLIAKSVPGQSWQGVVASRGDENEGIVRVSIADVLGQIAFVLHADQVPIASDHQYLVAGGTVQNGPSGREVVLTRLALYEPYSRALWGYHLAPVYVAYQVGYDRLFGDGNRGRHGVAIGLHAINSFLVYLLAVRLGLSRSLALLTGVLFCTFASSHEVVAWITGVHTSLMAMFVLASTVAYLKSGDEQKRRWYVAAFVLFLAGLLTKESGLFALVVLVGLEVTRRPKGLGGWVASVRRLAPFLILFIAYGAVKISVLNSDEQIGLQNQTAVYLLDTQVCQLINLFLPTFLDTLWRVAETVYPNGYDLGVWIAFPAAVVAVLILYSRGSALARFGWVWAVTFVAPLTRCAVPLSVPGPGRGFYCVGLFLARGLSKMWEALCNRCWHVIDRQPSLFASNWRGTTQCDSSRITPGGPGV